MTNSFTVEKTLKNGVQVLSFEVQADFDATQEILDINEYTQNIDAHYAYCERVSNDFVATYKVKVERQEVHERLVDMLQEEQRAVRASESERKKEYVNRYYNKGLVSRDEAIAHLNKMDKETENLKILSFRTPNFVEWKTGKYQQDEKRQMKLGKTLLKAGFSQAVIDFYSLQSKDEKETFLTISDLPQHIAGMSYYCDKGTWDGMNGSSCQDPRNDGRYPIALGGALNDNKLFVGMLHDSLDDLEDMTDKLIARTIFRYMSIDEQPALIATYYYGNNDTKDMLGNAIKQLGELDIFDKDVRRGSYNDMDSIKESANGYFDMMTTEEVHVEETIEEEVTVDCPMCSGSGNYEVYALGAYHDVTCPACGGDGDIETSVYIEVDEYIEVEKEEEIAPYAEGYSHYGYYTRMDVNITKIRESRVACMMLQEENA